MGRLSCVSCDRSNIGESGNVSPQSFALMQVYEVYFRRMLTKQPMSFVGIAFASIFGAREGRCGLFAAVIPRIYQGGFVRGLVYLDYGGADEQRHCVQMFKLQLNLYRTFEWKPSPRQRCRTFVSGRQPCDNISKQRPCGLYLGGAKGGVSRGDPNEGLVRGYIPRKRRCTYATSGSTLLTMRDALQAVAFTC